MGILFAAGLGAQCDEAEAHIRSQLAAVQHRRPARYRGNDFRSTDDGYGVDIDESDSGRPPPHRPRLILNVVGLSRGACAAMMLAQRLVDCDTALLRLNLCLVCGRFDVFTLCSSALDGTCAMATISYHRACNTLDFLPCFLSHPRPSSIPCPAILSRSRTPTAAPSRRPIAQWTSPRAHRCDACWHCIRTSRCPTSPFTHRCWACTRQRAKSERTLCSDATRSAALTLDCGCPSLDTAASNVYNLRGFDLHLPRSLRMSDVLSLLRPTVTQGALWSSPNDLACQLSFDCIRTFLHACGSVLDPASVRELFYFDQSELLAKLDREAVTQRAFADSNSNMGAEYGGDGSASGRGSGSGGSGSGGGSSSVAMAPMWSAENRPFVTQRVAHSCVSKLGFNVFVLFQILSTFHIDIELPISR